MTGLNHLRLNGLQMGLATERISSGVRINKGADDPSGLGISQGMKARLGGINTAIQNVQDSINMLRTSEGGLGEVTRMAQRIRDLCVRGANEATLTDADRDKIQDEINSLIQGINQVGAMTTYNTKRVTAGYGDFRTEFSSITVNDYAFVAGGPPGAGDPAYEAMKAKVLNVIDSAVYKVWGMIGYALPQNATMTVNFSNIDGNGNILATGGGAGPNLQMNVDVYDFLDPDGAGPLTAKVGSDPNVNDFTVEMVIAHEMTHAILVGNGAAGSAWGQEMFATYVSGEGDLRVKGNEAAVLAAVGGALTNAPASSADYAACALAAKFINQEHGAGVMYDVVQQVAGGGNWDTAIASVLGGTYANFAAFETASDAFSTGYINSGSANGAQKSGLGWTLKNPQISSEYHFKSQCGPDSAQQIATVTPWGAAGAGDYLCFANVGSMQEAGDSIESVDRALSTLGSAAAKIGVQERRLSHVLNDLNAEYINLTASRSRIYDADMSEEITNLTKTQIMRQTGTSVTAQANASPNIVLQLLNSSA